MSNDMSERNEKTSARVAAIASAVLRGEKISDEDLKSLAASALTQAPDKDILPMKVKITGTASVDDGPEAA